MVAASIPPESLDRIRDLLRLALDEPGRRSDTGQQAAILWWQLEREGLCETSTPEPWEEALLDLAAWHTDDDRLRFQRADEADLSRYLQALDH